MIWSKSQESLGASNAMSSQGLSQMAAQGSAGNVIAALCSFVVPGLGQLIQGRPIKALFHLVVDVILWIFLLGWLMHIWSALEAAWFVPRD